VTQRWQDEESYNGWCMTLLGTASVQSYVFSGNRLRDAVGGSVVVKQTMERWKGRPETVYIGGGNALLMFPSRQDAEAAVFAWSEERLWKAPGVRLVAAHFECGADLPQTLEKAQKLLQQNEDRPPFGAPLGALPVTRDCPSNGLAANCWDSNEDAWVNAATAVKRDSRNRARRQARDFEFPEKVDDLRTTEGASQIAVCHADGNGIGKLFSPRSPVLKELNGRTFLEKLVWLSGQVDAIGAEAFEATLRDVEGSLDDWCEAGVLSQGTQMPVVPVLMGGDDLTFVCHGRLGLAIVARYLEKYESVAGKQLPHLQLTACAGVLIQPQKFPLSRGSQLAHALCDSAKRYRRKRGEGCWLDFEIVKEGCPPDLNQMRQPPHGEAYRRPYRLGAGDMQGWNQFKKLWQDFGPAFPRSQAKGLQTAIVAGENATKERHDALKSRGYPLPSELADCYDVLDMVDFYTPWPKGGE